MEVFWPAEEVWYAAVVTEYSTETKMHSIMYDDNDTGLMDTSDRAEVEHRKIAVQAPSPKRGRGRPAASASNSTGNVKNGKKKKKR